MEVCISLLRENKDTLLGVLEPFIRDPTVSWGRSGRAQRPDNPNKIISGAIQDNDNADAKEALLKITERLNGIYNLYHPSGKRTERGGKKMRRATGEWDRKVEKLRDKQAYREEQTEQKGEVRLRGCRDGQAAIRHQ